MSDNEEAEAAETEEAEEEAQSGLQNGDFVRLAYTARTVESDQLVDTTDPEVAEEEGVDDQQQTFEPRVIVLGEGHIFGAVEDDLVGREAGDEGSVTVPGEEAFGERDPDEVRTISADKIPEDDRYPGAHVDVDGEHGHVEAIIGGRARVDFNHPLAGQDIDYDYEILDEVDDRVEQAKGLIGMYVDADLEMWIETEEEEEEVVVESDDDDEDAEPETETETVEKETLYVESTPQLAMNQQWMFSKQQIAQDVTEKLDLDRIIVQETLGEGAGMMGGMGGMMGGGMGGGDIEDALEDADVDADEIVDELEDVDE
ncbi:FKBP-type peptidyl-prolyl cis-trans isomerase SlyD [Natronoarchaeum philippinense]|uniref:Peptidyl-prolyl cis-trans isomerase n=1 Tax=Natronoarchaeum philippinense TaxID=558529 RepID=A0A285NBG3_NATPI|nr:peptidylprolyl isomerase [Natronoarchaeum philippinense]SNZ06253.1 FKBP-type peptidyl-prolyl cis-trans isomerase SlyD [Natronoarchaeum philippinense]